MNDLFGSLFGSLAPQQNDPLYSQYYNPKAAMMAAIGGGLQGVGAGLASGKPGAWAQGVALGSAEGLNNYQDNTVRRAAAARMLEEADYKKQERAQAAERQKWIDEQISQIPANQQGIARIMPEKFFGAQIEQMFPKPGADGNSGHFGMQVVPIRNKKTGELAAGQFNQSRGGITLNGEPIDQNEWAFDPGALSQDRAEGTMIGSAPKTLIEGYSTKTRPEMAGLADTISILRQAKTYLKKGIQTGSNSDKIQALRAFGAQFGFNVDENVLANTQSYQNFIGNVVIPRMKELGGNDSNEELAKLYSLSGGDINQSLPALANTLDFIEKLQERKFKRLKATEDVVLPYLPGLTPIDIGNLDAPAPTFASGMPDLSTMSDAELEALANGR